MIMYAHDASGNMRLRAIASDSLPNIAGQPVTQVAEPGDSVTFSVVVSAVSTVAFQWRFNGSEIAGATEDSLLVTNVAHGNEGVYSVDVKNSHGIVTSAEASLLIDSDRDGLPDSYGLPGTWEAAAFGDLTSQRSEGDPDQDGVRNLDEFRDGTIPAGPLGGVSFRPRLTVSWDAGGSVEVSPRQLTYALGDTVQLSATAFSQSASPPAVPPSVFARWEGDVETVGDLTAKTISLGMTRNRKVRARFATAVPLPPGIVALWRGEGDARDSIAGHHGAFFTGTSTTANTAPSCTALPVHIGRAFDFAGNAHVRVPSSLPLQPPQITVEAWVFFTQGQAAQAVIAHGSSGQDDETWNLGVNELGQPRFWTRPFDKLVEPSVLPLTQWTHLAGTYDGKIKRLYVNGVLVQSRAWAGPLVYDAGVPLTIGASWTNGKSNSFLTGQVDEVSLYSRALKANEVVDIFNADIAGKK